MIREKKCKSEELRGTEEYNKLKEQCQSNYRKKVIRHNRYPFFPVSDSYDWSNHIENSCKNFYRHSLFRFSSYK